MKKKWLKLKDGTDIFRIGRYNAIQIFKRPHGGYCCIVFDKGKCIAMNGYHATSLAKKYHAVRYGTRVLREQKII